MISITNISQYVLPLPITYIVAGRAKVALYIERVSLLKRICCQLGELTTTLPTSSRPIILTASRRYIHQMVGA